MILKPLDKRYKEDEIIKVIKENYGVKTYICSQLDCNERQLTNYLKKYPDVNEILIHSKEYLTDLAEKQIISLLNSTDENIKLKSTEFVLKCLGKNRGWIPSPDIMIGQQVELDEDAKIKKINTIFGLPEKED